jgi:hypothetical protein
MAIIRRLSSISALNWAVAHKIAYFYALKEKENYFCRIFSHFENIRAMPTHVYL